MSSFGVDERVIDATMDFSGSFHKTGGDIRDSTYSGGTIGSNNSDISGGEVEHRAQSDADVPMSLEHLNLGSNDCDGLEKSAFAVSEKDRICPKCGGDKKTACECPQADRNYACFTCGEEGHRAADCPQKPAMICRNCKEEGHKSIDCTANRVIDQSNIESMAVEEAWDKLQKADKKKNLDQIRKYIQVYNKSIDGLNWLDLEIAFRNHKFNTHVIGLQRDLPNTMTLMDLQGKLGCTYSIGLYFSAEARRSYMKENHWPVDEKDNLHRLQDAGLPVDRGLPKCSNCGEIGHVARRCEHEKVEAYKRVEIKCINCSEIGHRVRDCPQARQSQNNTCRNCGKEGHYANDCTEERSTEGVQCNSCNEMGHFSRDCPEKPKRTCHNCGEEGHMSKECPKPRNMDTMVCHNCDQTGHRAKDCPAPRDWSRVVCSNCGKNGHTRVRCREPPTEEENIKEEDDNKSNGSIAGEWEGEELDPECAW